MKSIIQKICIGITFICLYLPAFAYDFEVDGFFYNVTDQLNNEVAVTYKTTAYNSYSGVVDIPSQVSYNGTNYTVKGIGYRAFEDCSDLLSVTIPNSVTTIDNWAFYNCINIQSLVIGTGVTSIAYYAFRKNVTDGDPLRYTIPKVIWLCNTPPKGITNVDAGINYVSNSEFSLSDRMVYPFLSSRFEVDGVVYVPVSPSDRTCDVIDSNYDLYNSEITIGEFVDNKSVKLKVLNVNPYAFRKNPKITKLTINNCGYIGNSAFYRCDALTTVDASNFGDIGSLAFGACNALTTANVSNQGNICIWAFADCEALASLTVSNNGDIGISAFENCISLTCADLNNTGGILSEAFSCCSSLETVNINSARWIQEKAFARCGNLSSITLGDKITDLSDNVFEYDTSLETIAIPDNITEIGSSVFLGCSSLKNVKLGKGISVISYKLLKDCSSLSYIVIPGNIRYIGNNAFEGCTNLEDITFEELINVEAPRKQYFPEWTSTNHDAYSSSSHEYTIGRVYAGDALSFTLWSDCEKKDKLTVKLNGELIAEISGRNQSQNISMIFTTDELSRTLTVEYKKDRAVSEDSDEAGIRDLAINDDIAIMNVRLGTNGLSPLFSDCPLDEVYIGRKLSYNAVAAYGWSPFYRNSTLRKVTITDVETHIHDNEFYGCSNLQEFSCGNGVTNIGKRAFSGCSAMETYVSGINVTSIGEEAFSDCTSLTRFTSNADVPPICGSQALDDINKWECTLFVPRESVDDYQDAPQWKEFFFIDISGAEDVITDNQDASNYPIEIFNLSGFKVGNSIECLTSGIYIKRQGNTSEKIIIP